MTHVSTHDRITMLQAERDEARAHAEALTEERDEWRSACEIATHDVTEISAQRDHLYRQLETLNQQTNSLAEYSEDPEDCLACGRLDDTCPYHHGVGDGMTVMTRLFAAIADDPEPYFTRTQR